MKKTVIFILVFACIGVNLAAATDVSACGTLAGVGTYYDLTDDVSSTQGCFTLSGAGSTLDCHGHYINFGNVSCGISGTAAVYLNAAGQTIKNCVIVKNTTFNGNKCVGVQVAAANSAVLDNHIQTQGTSTANHAVLISSAAATGIIISGNYLGANSSSSGNTGINGVTDNTVIENNVVSVRATSSATGISASGKKNVTISNNSVLVYGGSTADYGLILVSSAVNNTVTGNIFNVSGAAASYALYISTGSGYNNFFNNTFSSVGCNLCHALYMSGSSTDPTYGNNFFNNSIISDGYDVSLINYVGNFNFSYNTLTTTITYNKSAVYFLNVSDTDFSHNNVQVYGSAYAFELAASVTAPHDNFFYDNIINSTKYPFYLSGTMGVNNLSVDPTAGLNVVGGNVIGGNFYDNSSESPAGRYSFDCTDADSNGYCDDPFIVNDNITDFYPLSSYAIGSGSGTNDIVLENFTISDYSPHSFNITAVFSDADGGTDIKNYSINTTLGTCNQLTNVTGGDFFNITINCTGPAFELTNVTLAVNDSAGNVTALYVEHLYPNDLPTHPSWITPTAGDATSSNVLEYSSADADNDTITYYIYVNGTFNKAVAGNTTITLTSEETYALNVSAYDGAYFSDNETVQFLYDATPPLLENFTISAETGIAGNPFTVYANFSEPYPLTAIVTIADANFTMTRITGTSTYYYSYLTVAGNYATYLVSSFWISDTAGNANSSNSTLQFVATESGVSVPVDFNSVDGNAAGDTIINYVTNSNFTAKPTKYSVYHFYFEQFGKNGTWSNTIRGSQAITSCTATGGFKCTISNAAGNVATISRTYYYSGFSKTFEGEVTVISGENIVQIPVKVTSINFGYWLPWKMNRMNLPWVFFFTNNAGTYPRLLLFVTILAIPTVAGWLGFKFSKKRKTRS